MIGILAEAPIDTDGDGIPNHCDLDSDNDGISDLVESGNQTLIDADTDGDGVVTATEAAAADLEDLNGDGVWDDTEMTPVDTDGDDIPDYLDLDSDNDGIPDAVENQPTNGFDGTGYVSPGKVDTDGDGVVDEFDDPSIEHGADFNMPVDTDGDGTPDYIDTDSDGDGMSDMDESGLTLSGMDTDGDGIDDAINASYCDPDGDVSDPSGDLDNELGGTGEVGFREVLPEIGVAKEPIGTPVLQANGNYVVTYSIVVENAGMLDIGNLMLVEDLAMEFGAPFVGVSNLMLATAPSDPDSNIMLDTAGATGWDGDANSNMIDTAAGGMILAAGDTFTVTFDVEVDPDAGGAATPLDNQVVVSGVAFDENGDPLLDAEGNEIPAMDDSDSGSNADPDDPNAGEPGDMGTTDDPTPLAIPEVRTTKGLSGDPVDNGDGTWTLPFTLTLENTCLLYTSPSPRDKRQSRMPSSA